MGRIPAGLQELLSVLKDEKCTLVVEDAQLAKTLNQLPELNVTAISTGPSVVDLYRAIRQNLPSLVPDLTAEFLDTCALGMSHSLSRHKLKFSADKVDMMVVQAVSLLDSSDKELNLYAMRMREWYGWHFPEMAKVLNDNLVYARVILAAGFRDRISKTDLSGILPEEMEKALKTAAEVSMGTDITQQDLDNIVLLATAVVESSEHRNQLARYLESRMRAIAPNLTELLGFLVGARLLAHAGSLVELAKKPGSTIQILGAEKALFRALKTKHATPKYGLIYQTSLIGRAQGKYKGKMARMLASKAALGIRVDALTGLAKQAKGEVEIGPTREIDEEERVAVGLKQRIKLERFLDAIQGRERPSGISASATGNGVAPPRKFEVKDTSAYNKYTDGLEGAAAPEPMEEDGDEEEDDEMPDANNALNAPASPTLDSVSEDSEDVDAEAGGKEVKKLRKAQKKRRAERNERRTQVMEQRARRAMQTAGLEDVAKSLLSKISASARNSAAPKPLSDAEYERLATASGISVSKFKRKYERGEAVVGEDGQIRTLSKKELKAMAKAQAAEEDGGSAKSGEKRKRQGGDEKAKKKKKLIQEVDD